MGCLPGSMVPELFLYAGTPPEPMVETGMLGIFPAATEEFRAASHPDGVLATVSFPAGYFAVHAIYKMVIINSSAQKRSSANLQNQQLGSQCCLRFDAQRDDERDAQVRDTI